jgi:hypothetical protein
MYKMMGADGKEYGPVSAEQLRQWITEGRANAQTHVLPQGGAEWKTLAELPEFAQSFSVTASARPVAAPGYAGVSSSPKTNSMAVAGLVMGLLSVTCGLCCYGAPFNLLGIIFSLIALSQLKSDRVSQQGRGIAIAGLILSILGIVVGVLFFVLNVAVNSGDIWRKLENL